MSETIRKVLTPTETRKILGISKNVMYELLARDKTFPAFKIGNKWFINADKLNDWIDDKSDKKIVRR